MVARPGDRVWSRLAINCQLLARVSYLRKVGKNNFRPPPKVESALVRIEPRRPPPPINFMEWDGMIRICFERPNKNVRNPFLTKTVLSTLEKNHKTFCQLNQKTPVKDMKSAVLQILEQSGLAKKKSRHLDITQFLRLMKLFNDANIHFK